MNFDKKYFSSQNYKGVTFKKYSMYWWSNRFFAHLINKYTKNQGEILELGCGFGDILFNLSKNEKLRLTGVDISRFAINKARKKLPYGIFYCSDIDNLNLKKESYDLILAKHVLEHVRNPEEAIHKVYLWLKKGSVFIIVTPNLNCLLKPLKGRKWHGYVDKTHISLRLPSEWEGLLQKEGFSLVKIFSDGFWNVPYFPLVPNIVQKIIFGLPGGIQAITKFIFLPERLGESLIIICKK